MTFLDPQVEAVVLIVLVLVVFAVGKHLLFRGNFRRDRLGFGDDPYEGRDEPGRSSRDIDRRR